MVIENPFITALKMKKETIDKLTMNFSIANENYIIRAFREHKITFYRIDRTQQDFVYLGFVLEGINFEITTNSCYKKEIHILLIFNGGTRMNIYHMGMSSQIEFMEYFISKIEPFL